MRFIKILLTFAMLCPALGFTDSELDRRKKLDPDQRFWTEFFQNSDKHDLLILAEKIRRKIGGTVRIKRLKNGNLSVNGGLLRCETEYVPSMYDDGHFSIFSELTATCWDANGKKFYF